MEDHIHKGYGTLYGECLYMGEMLRYPQTFIVMLAGLSWLICLLSNAPTEHTHNTMSLNVLVNYSGTISVLAWLALLQAALLGWRLRSAVGITWWSEYP